MTEPAPAKPIGRAAKIAFAGLALVLVLAGLTAFLALSGPGHRTIERTAATLSGGEVKITGLSGNLFTRISAERVEISDDGGMWLRVDRPDITWRALALLDNRADIRTLTAARVMLNRLPRSKTESSESHFRIDIGALSIGEARIAKAAFGHAARLRLRGSLHYRSRRDAALRLVADRLEGDGRYRADLRLHENRLSGTADIAEDRDGFIGALAGLPDIGPVRLHLTAGPGRDGLALDLHAGALSAQVRGLANLTGEHLDARFSLSAPAMAPRPDLSWRSLNGAGTLTGSVTHVRVQAELNIADLNAGSTTADRVSLAAAADGRDGRIALSGRIDGLRLANRDAFANAPLRLQAGVDLADERLPFRLNLDHPLLRARAKFQHTDGWSGTLHLDAPRLGPLAGLAGVALDGSARLDATLKDRDGSMNADLTGDIAATGDTVAARLIRRSTIALSAARDGDTFRGRMEWRGGALAGEIRARYADDRPSGTARVTFADLSALSPKLGGTLRLDARLDGEAVPKLAVTGSGRIAAAGGKAERIAFTLNVDDPLGRPAGTLRLKGHFAGAPVQLAAKRDARGRIDLDRLSWKSLSGHGYYRPGARPDAQADLRLTNLADLAPFAPGLGGRIEAQLRLGAGRDRLAVAVRGQNLAAGKTKIGTLTVSGGIDALHTAPKLALTLALPELSVDGMAGAVAGAVTGPLAAPEAKLSARLATDSGPLELVTRARYEREPQKLTIAQMQLRWNDRTLGLAAPATIRQTAAGTLISLRLAGDAGASLTLQGRIPASAAESYDLHASGSAEIGDWTGFLSADGRSLRGRLTFAAQLRGRSAAPAIFGSARLEKGRYQDFSTGIRLNAIEAALSANGSRIRLERFTASAHDGRISGSGNLDIAGEMPVDIRFTADKARPFVRDGIKLFLSGDGRISGTLKGNLTVAGALTIPKAEIRIPDKLPADIAVLHVQRKNAPPAPPPPHSRVALAMTITSPGEFFLRGHGLEAELEGKLRITGTTSAPHIEGKLTMRHGTYALSGNPLEFESGSIGFTGFDLDPSLDFSAETTSDSLTATLKITGTASHPKIDLTSSPNLPQDEILAQLLFQQSTQDLSAVQLAQIAQSLAALSGLGTGIDPVGLVRSSLGLDKLTVGSSSSDSSTTVEAGKYVLRNVYVGAKQNLSGGTRAEVQVDVGRRLKLHASVNAAGETAVPTTSGDTGDTVGLSYSFDY